MWNAPVAAEDGIVEQCTDGQAVKDSIRYLPNLQAIRFAVLENALFVVGVVLLQRAYLVISSKLAGRINTNA